MRFVKYRSNPGNPLWGRIALAWLSLALLGSVSAWAKPTAKASTNASTKAKTQTAVASGNSEAPHVDLTKVHRLYLDGDFEPAIAMLENALKEKGQYTHGDSVSIFKHLGVMYAAQSETREKGKYYMHKLLMVEPTAKIMDMYASDMIYMIYKNIQEEFEQNRALAAPEKNADQADSMPTRNQTPLAAENQARSRAPKEEARASGSKKWVWAGAAVVTVAAGAGAYYLLSQKPKQTVTENEVQF
ncbi:MAG: hypothetical protein ABI036_13450 [Fibrobacteria bacterium]